MVSKDQKNYIQSCLNKKQYGLVKEEVDRLLVEDPKDPDLLGLMGIVYFRQNLLDQAYDFLKEASALLPLNPIYHFYLGELYRERKGMVDATDSYRRSLSLFTSHMAKASQFLRQGKISLGVWRQDFFIAKSAFDTLDVLHSLCMEDIIHYATTLLAGEQFIDANTIFHRAFLLEPENPLLKKELRSYYTKYFPSFYFRLLNDSSYTSSYRKAIENCVKKGDLVVELGADHMILSLMAARAGASKVAAFVRNSVVADLAKKVAKENGYSGVIDFENREVLHLGYGDLFKKKADLLIADIRNPTVVGSGLLYDVQHARKHILKEEGRVFPQSVALMGCLAGSSCLEKQVIREEIEGFNLSRYNELGKVRQIIEPGSSFPRFFSDPKELILIDFNRNDFESLSHKATLVAKEKCCAVGLLQWVKVYIDEENSYENSPFCEGGELWSLCLHYFMEPIDLEEGEKVDVEFACSGMRIEMVSYFSKGKGLLQKMGSGVGKLFGGPS